MTSVNDKRTTNSRARLAGPIAGALAILIAGTLPAGCSLKSSIGLGGKKSPLSSKSGSSNSKSSESKSPKSSSTATPPKRESMDEMRAREMAERESRLSAGKKKRKRNEAQLYAERAEKQSKNGHFAAAAETYARAYNRFPDARYRIAQCDALVKHEPSWNEIKLSNTLSYCKQALKLATSPTDKKRMQAAVNRGNRAKTSGLEAEVQGKLEFRKYAEAVEIYEQLIASRPAAKSPRDLRNLARSRRLSKGHRRL